MSQRLNLFQRYGGIDAVLGKFRTQCSYIAPSLLLGAHDFTTLLSLWHSLAIAVHALQLVSRPSLDRSFFSVASSSLSTKLLSDGGIFSCSDHGGAMDTSSVFWGQRLEVSLSLPEVSPERGKVELCFCTIWEKVC